METLRKWADKLRSEIWILYRAFKDTDTPWYAKTFLLVILAYVLSPIDLIPDFIPVIGYLDDLILVPLGIFLATKMIPLAVLEKHRKETKRPVEETDRIGKMGVVLVVFSWLLLIALFTFWASRFLMETG